MEKWTFTDYKEVIFDTTCSDWSMGTSTFDSKLFEKEKIIYSEISKEPSFTLDTNNYFLGNTAYILNSNSINLKYLLGLLNSNVLFWIFKHI